MDKSIIKKVEVVSVHNNTKDSRTIILRPMDDWQPVYKTGQFITLVFYTKNGEQRRSYSISSSPVANEPLSITVKKLDNGEFSRWLVYKVKPGDVLLTSGINGFFVLPENVHSKTFCFLAAGSGITPCFSLIKTILLTTQQKIFLFYSNRNEADTIFLQELKTLQKQNPYRLFIHFMFSNKLDVYYSRLSHWLLTHLIDQHFQHIAKPDILFYICGPFDYMLMAGISLRNNGITNSQIIKEDFNPLPPVKLPKPPDTTQHNVTMHVGGRTYTIAVRYPQSIVAAAKQAKISVPYSCEAGRCGSCVATCISGEIWMAYNEVLLDEEIARGRVLTCQGFPINGNAEIVYE
ncbi:flavin reductase family protein [Niabella ginsengisoli]|uniref:Iron-sulfur cluster-binding domain-containing protein n=1 Tax=Niabella ginsengisoli TaxID=522298 RepID=A0ABS9SLU8_9BACT|nr:iron-sulfur cluster-binding domain-containing protein [Niabella ginsengisoli]MCH5599327.1 iron-sulfur cluster-binding domain-containing protein [Niabella ginsengisoli]